jgi:hypothetical protein
MENPKGIALMGIAGDDTVRLELDEEGILAIEIAPPKGSCDPGSRVFLDEHGQKRLFSFLHRAYFPEGKPNTLREITGAGILDCKRAIEKHPDSMENAIRYIHGLMRVI